jgi:RNA polymerase sigma-70 factor (family 1)
LHTFALINTFIAKQKVSVSISENEIINGLRNGDEKIFESIFRDYYEKLCNYANKMIQDMDEAEEMVQGTFLNIWEKREDIEIHTSVKSYLYRAVHNNCLNRIKHYKVKREYSENYKHEADLEYSDASHDLAGKEMEQQIQIAIESMPPQCRTVFKLNRFENLTYAEIAGQMNLSVNTIENHMVKALKILREKLSDYLPFLLWLLFSINRN